MEIGILGSQIQKYRKQRGMTQYGMKGNLVAGANIAGFLKVAEAMKAQGCV